MSRIALTAALALAALSPLRAQLIVNSGEYVIDGVTHTGPQSHTFLEVGVGAEAVLRILDGRVVRCSGSGFLGLTASGLGSAAGTVEVAGRHSRLTFGSGLGIGRNLNGPGVQSLGVLNVSEGGHVRASFVAVPDTIHVAQGRVSVSGRGALLETTGSLGLTGSASVDGRLTIGPGGTVSVGTGIVASGNPEIRLEGGTLSLPGPGALPGGVLQFTGGRFRFRSAQTLDGGAGFYTGHYGSPPVLAGDPALILDGTTTLATPLTLDGGSLRTGAIAVVPEAGSVLLAGGTLTLSGEGTVLDDGGDFGPDPLTVGDGSGAPAKLVLRSPGTVLLGDVTVLSDGALSFAGETLVLDSLTNAGSVGVTGATLNVRGGLVNTGSLRLADVVVEGNVDSPAGSRIDVFGTVVFNGSFTGAAAFHGSGDVIFNGAAR